MRTIDPLTFIDKLRAHTILLRRQCNQAEFAKEYHLSADPNKWSIDMHVLFKLIYEGK